jgi:hypothetical protein
MHGVAGLWRMIVHVAWLGSPSQKATAAAEALQKSLPHHDVRFHRDDSLLWDGWMGAYERIAHNPYAASDLLRHSVLRRAPGLWLDLDVRLAADPDQLVASWDRYTVLRIPGTSWAGTDVIYVPAGWPHWHLVDEYIDSLDLSAAKGYLLFAHDMISAVWRRNRESIAVVDNAELYPCAPAHLTAKALVLRCGLAQKQVSASGGECLAGAELKKLLATIGITAKPTCSCNARARAMDANGCEWCESNMDTIVGWLREEAAKRGLPFLDAAGRLLVRRAIKNARKAAS